MALSLKAGKAGKRYTAIRAVRRVFRPNLVDFPEMGLRGPPP
jgi:hypothetical protein